MASVGHINVPAVIGPDSFRKRLLLPLSSILSLEDCADPKLIVFPSEQWPRTLFRYYLLAGRLYIDEVTENYFHFQL